jgi:hypothetical protein
VLRSAGGFKQAAEKSLVAGVDCGPQRLKPDLFQLITYGLKAVPFKKTEFFRSLFKARELS